MPCLAHIFNLAVQDSLKEFKATNEGDPHTSCRVSLNSLGDVIPCVRQIMKKYYQFYHDFGLSSTSMPRLDIST